ncbi:GyrI-like domain-containing protein [Leucobacter luti]|uniref:GyrI-like domain-containing protein n=1 Tax=Leucobacter luti TaxID=340320 RepID=UPI003D07BAFA
MEGRTGKVDLKRVVSGYRGRVGSFERLRIPERSYLALEGSGDPNTSEEFASALGALYPLAYKLKFLSKNELGRDYVVPPLEALWWADDMASFTSGRDKNLWHWTAMLLVPEWLGAAEVEAARAAALAKGAPDLVGQVRLFRLDEGECVQTLHVGSFDDEGPVLERMHEEFIADQGLSLAGRHHEIYLSDFRRVPAERCRTILRQPVAVQAELGVS